MSKLNLVVDLDETMVFSFFPSDEDYKIFKKKEPTIDNYYEFKLNDGTQVCGLIRPHAIEFLSFCFENMNVGFWSAGVEDYVIKIVKILLSKVDKMGQKCVPSFIYYRDMCDFTVTRKKKGCSEDCFDCYSYNKPLTTIYNSFPTHSAHNTLIIDDRRSYVQRNILNWIEIKPYSLGDGADSMTEVDKLFGMLKLEDNILFQAIENLKKLIKASPTDVRKWVFTMDADAKVT